MVSVHECNLRSKVQVTDPRVLQHEGHYEKMEILQKWEYWSDGHENWLAAAFGSILKVVICANDDIVYFNIIIMHLVIGIFK